MNTFLRHTALIFSTLCATVLNAQQVNLTLERDSIMIGEQVAVTLAVDYRVNVDSSFVTWPELGESLSEGVDIISKSGIDTIANIDDADPFIFRQEMRMQISAFDSGFFAIEPLQFVVNGEIVESNAALLSAYYPVVDMQADIKDIKGIHNIEFGFWDWIKVYWYWVVTGVVVLGLLGWLIWYLTRKKRVVAHEQVAPQVVVPAHVLALKRLDELEKRKLWQDGKVKAYYTILTNIFREYLERRYDIRAMEETSEEIMIGVRRKALSGDVIERIGELLALADLVKFAKEKPLPSDHERAISAIREFVNNSKLEPEHV